MTQGSARSLQNALMEKNAGPLVNYGVRYPKELPNSSSIVESAVELVVIHLMAKKQQMRWTGEGAHCLAQARVAVLKGEFSVETLAALTTTAAVSNSASTHRAARIDLPRFGSLSPTTDARRKIQAVMVTEGWWFCCRGLPFATTGENQLWLESSASKRHPISSMRVRTSVPNSSAIRRPVSGAY
jgi:hypothetical protein